MHSTSRLLDLDSHVRQGKSEDKEIVSARVEIYRIESGTKRDFVLSGDLNIWSKDGEWTLTAHSVSDGVHRISTKLDPLYCQMRRMGDKAIRLCVRVHDKSFDDYMIYVNELVPDVDMLSKIIESKTSSSKIASD